MVVMLITGKPEEVADAEMAAMGLTVHGNTKEVDVGTIEKLAALSCTIEEIAGFFDVSLSTLKRRLREPKYRTAFVEGRAKGKVALRRAQFRVASKGNTTMLVWLGKQMLGQKDSKFNNITASDELPPSDEENFLILPWTPELREEYETIDGEYEDLTKE